jgi:hypothetical protein
MYRRKLQNQIDELRLPPLRQPVRTPVLLADSKGFNLQQQVKVNPESFIQFWCKSSATAENKLQYLQDNLGSKTGVRTGCLKGGSRSSSIWFCNFRRYM